MSPNVKYEFMCRVRRYIVVVVVSILCSVLLILCSCVCLCFILGWVHGLNALETYNTENECMRLNRSICLCFRAWLKLFNTPEFSLSLACVCSVPFYSSSSVPHTKNCTGSWIIYLYAGGFQWPIWSTYTVIKRKLWQRTGNCIILSKRMTAGADETPKWCQYTTNKRTFILSFCWFLIVKWLQANCRPIKMNTHGLLWVYYLRATEQGKRNKLRNEQVSMENRKKRKKIVTTI